MTDSKQPMTSLKRSDALPPPPKEELEKALKIDHVRVEWLAGDGSDRCYYRLHSDELSEPLVLMQLSENDAIKLREDGYDWLKMARILKSHGLRVPAPIATLNDHAALVIEDYGDVMLESLVVDAWAVDDKRQILAYYDDCFDVIATMLNIPRDPQAIWCQRAFDFEKYSWELRFFKREYLEASLGLKLSPEQWQKFDDDILRLAQDLVGYSTYFTHRDFHSRNIMVKNKQLALIDFQDARLGAASYDLVSLIFDNYVPFSPDFRKELLMRGSAALVKSVHGLNAETLKKELPGITLQRQLKAIGTYGFLTNNKKRGNYLRYVEPALASLLPELVEDSRWPFISHDLLAIIRKALGDG